MGYTPHVVVVGGGLTGVGLARDLAMRGLEVTVVERGKLTDGSTGRIGGRLHSGVVEVAEDHTSVQRRLSEHRTLKRIAGHCLEDTGGLVVSLDSDDPERFEETREVYETAGTDVTTHSGAKARDLEPSLTEDVGRALQVPDAAVDPFRLTVANARSARHFGASIRTHSPVTDIVVDGSVSGVETDGDESPAQIDADYVVNAAGLRAGEVAAMASFDRSVGRSKTVRLVVNERPSSRVLTRCCPPGDGGTLVPYDGRSILGGVETAGDPASLTESAVEAVVDDVSAMVPELRHGRPIRSYTSVSPRLPSGEPVPGGARLVDHGDTDGVWGMTTVLGGSVATYRLVAKQVADHVCAKFGIDRDCLTGTEALPGGDLPTDPAERGNPSGLEPDVVEASRTRLGSRAGEVLETNVPNPVLCECEMVTRAEVRDAIDDETGKRTDLGEVRIRTRAAMGSCQGGRCCHTLASELYPVEDIDTIDRALDDLVDNRWQGQRHALWGEQLAQAMCTYERHAGTLNRAGSQQPDDLSAFDSGPEWGDDDLNPRGGGFRP
jgi:glycerol-3-phosphate dehydrogenase